MQRWCSELPNFMDTIRMMQTSPNSDGGNRRTPVLTEVESSNRRENNRGERKKKDLSGHGVKMNLGPLLP